MPLQRATAGSIFLTVAKVVKGGSKGVAKVLPNESLTLRVLVRTDLLPAGKLKVFSVSTLEQRNEIRCLSSTSNPAVSSEMCKS